MNIKSIELNGYSANDVIRYGRIEISLQNYSQRYLLVFFQGKYYEFHMNAGKLEEFGINKEYPKHLKNLEVKFN